MSTEKKHYRVLVTASATVLVEQADDEAHARTLAHEELRSVPFSALQFDSAQVIREVDDDELEMERKQADAISSP